MGKTKELEQENEMLKDTLEEMRETVDRLYRGGKALSELAALSQFNDYAICRYTVDAIEAGSTEEAVEILRRRVEAWEAAAPDFYGKYISRQMGA